MVQLTRGGEPVRMGKRTGEFVSLEEVLEEVGRDAARFFFLMRKSDSHLDFDLELAKQQSSDNPVFYVQYAHARVASIFEQAAKSGIALGAHDSVPVERLELAEELELIRRMIQFNDVVEESVRELEPHRLVFYLLELAGEFHRYYNRHRVISDDKELSRARLLLVENVQKTIRRGLEILGVCRAAQNGQSCRDGGCAILIECWRGNLSWRKIAGVKKIVSILAAARWCLLGGAFVLASVVIFFLGMFVGKSIEERKIAKQEEPLVRIPVKPESGAASGATVQKRDEITFNESAAKAPAAAEVQEKSPAEKPAEKIAKAEAPPAKIEKKPERVAAGGGAEKNRNCRSLGNHRSGQGLACPGQCLSRRTVGQTVG